MDPTLPPPLLMPLPRPERGAATRVQLGSSEVVLEAVRGGCSLLWSNGRSARRYVLGLRPDGRLSLQLRAPRLPVCVVPREVLTLVPRGRCSGYVQVPLVPTLVWHGADEVAHVLVELRPDDLVAEWDETTGHTLQASSPWCVRFPMRSGEPRVVVPMHLGNPTAEVCSPAHLPVPLRDDELRPLRGSIVVRPRRLRWNGTSWHAGAGVQAAVEALA